MAAKKEGFAARDYQIHPVPDYPDYRSSIWRHPQQKLVTLPQTIGDTSSPVFKKIELGGDDHDMIINYTGLNAIGERIMVHGRVFDEAARPLQNTLIEVWQANAGGRYRHQKDDYEAPLDPNFGGCARCLTDDEGYYFFRTIKPGPYPWPNGGNDWRPSHIHFSVFGRGFAQRLITQMYFEGDPHIAICPIVQSIADPQAIEQLVARLDMSKSVPMDFRAYRFDIVLRGPKATFFENKRTGN